MKPQDAPQGERDFQPSPTEPIVHGVGQIPVPAPETEEPDVG